MSSTISSSLFTPGEGGTNFTALADLRRSAAACGNGAWANMGLRWVLVLVLCLACRTDGHGKLTSPTPRVGTAIGDGAKLTRGSARDVNCGGTENGDPGFTLPGNQPKIAYTVGANVGIVWDLTIPHPADNLNNGVRIAIHFNDGDSFNNNVRARSPVKLAHFARPAPPNARVPWQILLGCLDGDLGCEKVDAGGLSRLVKLPEGRLCSYCVLQWIWEAKTDGGHYVQCADIAITETGELAPLPSNHRSLTRCSDLCAVGGCRPAA